MKFLQFILVLCFFPKLDRFLKVTNYCQNIRLCRDGSHTVCKRNHQCGSIRGKCEQIDSDFEFRQEMVDMHNDLRNNVANGTDRRGTNTGVQNMNAISYDMELEFTAQCWCNCCPTLTHDKCKHVKRFYVGQNIFWTKHNKKGIDHKHAMSMFYEEIEHITEAKWLDYWPPEDFPKDGIERGHYTQLVWADTKFIGCARSKFLNGKNEYNLICNYGTAGNVMRNKTYIKAHSDYEIAAMCQTINPKYRALCGNIKPVPIYPAWTTCPYESLEIIDSYSYDPADEPKCTNRTKLKLGEERNKSEQCTSTLNALLMAQSKRESSIKPPRDIQVTSAQSIDTASKIRDQQLQANRLLWGAFLTALCIWSMIIEIECFKIYDYCQDYITGCEGQSHTVCKRNHYCGKIPTKCEQINSDLEFRQEMVHIHNELRNKIANGSEKRGTNTGAQNMNAVSYDLELEFTAQCWCNTCPTYITDECRNVRRFDVGQNVYWVRLDKNGINNWYAITTCYEEIRYITDPKWIDEFPRNGFPDDGIERSHYTQLVWAKTTLIGCGRSKFLNDKDEFNLVCNYGTAGNIKGTSVYEKANSPSEIARWCKNVNPKYNALCGEIQPIPTNPSWTSYSYEELEILPGYAYDSSIQEEPTTTTDNSSELDNQVTLEPSPRETDLQEFETEPSTSEEITKPIEKEPQSKKNQKHLKKNSKSIQLMPWNFTYKKARKKGRTGDDNDDDDDDDDDESHLDLMSGHRFTRTKVPLTKKELLYIIIVLSVLCFWFLMLLVVGAVYSVFKKAGREGVIAARTQGGCFCSKLFE